MPDPLHDSLTQRLTALHRPLPKGLVARALHVTPAQPVRRDSLSDRLSALHRPLPARVVSSVSAATTGQRVERGPHRVRRRRTLIAAMVALLAVNGAATYFVPVYAAALGHLPGVGDFLRWSGLGTADLTIIDAGTDHDGIGLHVSAGYADENRTVLILDFHGPKNGSGPAVGGFGELSLTDQFGHTYREGVSGWGIKGQPEPAQGQDVPGYATFDPMTGPAAVVGARLTLTGHQFDLGSDARGQLLSIRGTWQVSFILERHPATHVPWASAAIAGASYTFDHVTITGGTLVEIGWKAAGPAVRAANLAIEAANLSGQPSPPGCNTNCVRPGAPEPADPLQFIRPFMPHLIDVAGHEVAQSGALGNSGGSSEDWVEWTFDYLLKPGQYRFVLPTSAGFGFERDLSVP